MDVRTRIRSYFARTVAAPASAPLGDDDDIFVRGLVSSMFAMQLLAFIEREFEITAERDDLNIANFSSISALTGFVEAKLGRPAR